MVIAQCAGCAREGAWTKKCGRCKKTVYCSPECQRSHWKAHKAECYAAAPLVVTEKPGPSPPPPKKKRVFLLTDGLLRVAYLEGCSKAGGLAHVARRMDAFGEPIAAAWVGSKAAGTLRQLDDVTRESLLAVATLHMERLARENPNCSLQFEAEGLKMAAPLSDDAPWLPALRLDDCVPTAFVAFSCKGALSKFFTTLKADDEALAGLTDPTSPLSAMGGFDGDDGEPRPMKEFMGGIMVTFSGLASARRKMPALYACFLGGAKNNFVAGACAKKALLYTLGEERRYASPVRTNETVHNKRGVVHTAKMFASLTLRDLALLTERQCVDEFKCAGKVAYPSQLTSCAAAV